MVNRRGFLGALAGMPIMAGAKSSAPEANASGTVTGRLTIEINDKQLAKVVADEMMRQLRRSLRTIRT